MSNTVFDRPDVIAFARLDGLGLEVTGQRIEIVAMDGFTGFTSAAAEELPGARVVRACSIVCVSVFLFERIDA